MGNLINSKLWKYGLVASIGMLILFFNNCKSSSENAMQLQSVGTPEPTASGPSQLPTGPTGATGTLCEQDIKNLYARGWQKFLFNNCSSCHSNGPGKGRFANPEVNLAYSEFELVGYTKVSSNATNPGHNAPYSGLHNTQIVNELKLEWMKGLQDYASCSGTTAAVPQEAQIEKINFRSTEQVIGLANAGDRKVLTWNVNTDLTRIKGTGGVPTVPGARFSITVTRLLTGGGFTYYTFSSPTFHGATTDAHIEGVFINLNGLLLTYPTTFSFISKDIRMGTLNDLSGLISTGSLVAPKVVSPTDTVSISFIDIRSTVMPPPPPPTVANLGGARTVVVPKGTDFIDIDVTLTNPAVEPIIVTVAENNDLCGTAGTITNSNTLFRVASTTCLPNVYAAICPGGTCVAAARDFGKARQDVGATFKRYDWDFKFPTSSVSFMVGESSKPLRVYFSKDIRREQNRVLTLDIASVLGSGVTIGANRTTQYVITKHDNPIPSGSTLTFSELMNPTSGILGQNCTACHNSTDLAGNYDMTDHELMIRNGVLIPGDITSKMYLRMHPTPEFLGKPMPLNGFLTQDKILEVELWIRGGALNN